MRTAAAGGGGGVLIFAGAGDGSCGPGDALCCGRGLEFCCVVFKISLLFVWVGAGANLPASQYWISIFLRSLILRLVHLSFSRRKTLAIITPIWVGSALSGDAMSWKRVKHLNITRHHISYIPCIAILVVISLKTKVKYAVMDRKICHEIAKNWFSFGVHLVTVSGIAKAMEKETYNKGIGFGNRFSQLSLKKIEHY